MAISPSTTQFTPLTEDQQAQASSNLASIDLPSGYSLPLYNTGATGILPSDATNKANATQQSVIRDASATLNDSKGRPASPPPDVLARQIRRNTEETRSFRYLNPYFAGPQVGVFIGDRWVTNAVTIEYTESSTDSPVYGYSSRWFDAVMQGQVIVQGNMMIAFTDGAYLGNLLSLYHSGEGQGDSAVPGPTDPISIAKQFWWGLGQTIESSINTTVPMNFRQTPGIAGYIGRGFDIRVFFGAQEFLDSDKAVTPTGPIEVIKDVHITSRALVVSPSGDPIAESWSFFARSCQTIPDKATSPTVSSLRVLPLNGNMNVTSPTNTGQPVTAAGNTTRLGFPS